MDNMSIKGQITINAIPAKVWNVLTDPRKIIQYIGSQTITDWAVGSPITWEGEMQGMKFQNKGIVLENVSNERLRFTYWSGMGGDADEPKNYSEITYLLKALDKNQTEFTYLREKIPTIFEKQIFERHLQSMLEEIQRLSEG